MAERSKLGVDAADPAVRTAGEAPAPPIGQRRASRPDVDSLRPKSALRGEAALRGLLTEGLDPLYRFILFRVGCDPHRAEDLLQQTAYIALNHERAPKDAQEQEWWLKGIARNLIRQHWRQRRRAEAALGDASLNGRGRTADADDSPPAAAAKGSEVMRLMTALTDLPSDDQALVYLFYKRRRSTAQIAEELGVSEKSVECRLYRIRHVLRNALSESGAQS